MTQNAVYMLGFVVGSNQAGPAQANAITYSIAVNLPNGTVTVIHGVRPKGLSISDYYPGIDVMALRYGEPVEVVMIGSVMIVFANPECPKVVDCSGNPMFGSRVIENPVQPGQSIVVDVGPGTASVGGVGSAHPLSGGGGESEVSKS